MTTVPVDSNVKPSDNNIELEATPSLSMDSESAEDEDDKNVDFSVLQTWTRRAQLWSTEFRPEQLRGMKDDAMILRKLSYIEDGENSITFAVDLKACVKDIREKFEEIASSEAQKDAWEKEIAPLEDEITVKQEEIDALTLEEQRASHDLLHMERTTTTTEPPYSEYAIMRQHIEGRLKDKRQLIMDKRKLIEKTRQMIADKRQMIADKKVIIDQTRLLISKSHMDFFTDSLRGSADAHKRVASLLDVYNVKGNETTHNYGSETQKPSASMAKDLINSNLIPSATSIAKALGSPNEDPSLKAQLLNGFDDDDDETHQLQRFQEFVTDILSPENTITEVVNPERRDQVLARTIDAIISQKKEENTQYLRPSETTDQETAVEQPIAYAILFRILQIINMQDFFITKEQFVPRLSKGSALGARRVDFLVHAFREHLPSILHVNLAATVEIKASCVIKKNAKGKSKGSELTEGSIATRKMEKGENQNIGHLSKKASASFHFMGVGSDITLHGITMTLHQLSVVELRLEHVGTKDVKVCVVRTPRLSFVSDKDAFVVLAGTLKKSLQRSDKLPFSKIVRPIRNDSPFEEIHIGNFLGSGAFAYAYEMTKVGLSEEQEPEGEYFIKFAKQALASNSLRRERRILKSLGEHGNIPVYDGLYHLEFTLHGQVGRSTGLVLKGIVGISADQAKRTCGFEYFVIVDIVAQVYGALSYAHGKGIFHLDIRPSNIIVESKEVGNWKVMVSDWGCAAKTNDEFVFRGCIPFAHDRLLSLSSSTLSKKSADRLTSFDWASLAYTFYSLCRKKNSDLPWVRYVHNRNCSQDALDRRRFYFAKWWNRGRPKQPVLGSEIRDALFNATQGTEHTKLEVESKRKRNLPQRYVPPSPKPTKKRRRSAL